MKTQNLVATLTLTLGLLAAVTGCQHKPVNTTIIPDLQNKPVANAPSTEAPGTAITPSNPVTSTPEGTAETYGNYTNLFDNPHNDNRDQFKADIVYFDFDSSTIKASEETKLQEVAAYFKGNQKAEALIIEGNCDERGTEKYNLSLGERRALAAREYLVNLGVDSHRIKTVTYGASRPAEPGKGEEHWKKNRRDEFVHIAPKQ